MLRGCVLHYSVGYYVFGWKRVLQNPQLGHMFPNYIRAHGGDLMNFLTDRYTDLCGYKWELRVNCL